MPYYLLQPALSDRTPIIIFLGLAASSRSCTLYCYIATGHMNKGARSNCLVKQHAHTVALQTCEVSAYTHTNTAALCTSQFGAYTNISPAGLCKNYYHTVLCTPTSSLQPTKHKTADNLITGPIKCLWLQITCMWPTHSVGVTWTAIVGVTTFDVLTSSSHVYL